MSINIGPPSVEELRPRITVIGVGGAGGNAIANMIQAEIEGVDFIVANTDAQALNNSVAEHRIQLGPDITRGLGAGSRPEVGRAAAEETVEEIERALEGVQHGVHRRRHGRRHRHRRGAGHRRSRAQQGHPHGRRGDQAVPVRRHPAHALGRSRASTSCRSRSTR